jgi:SAM-dependent methyltransferase
MSQATAPEGAGAATRALRNTDLDWIRIGEEEPYHGVLSHERFLTRNLTPEVLADFWRSGEEEIHYLVSVATQHFGAFEPRRALDFGCGVGRLTRAMAQIADTVVGVDISPGMLAEACRGAPPNITFVADAGDERFDWISSIIVFQHIPPLQGYDLFEQLLARLIPGGVLTVQVTLYRDSAFLPATLAGLQEAAWDGETLRALRQEPPAPGVMLMYDYDLNRLIALLARHGLGSVFLEHTDHGGCHGVRLFARKDG